MIFYDLNEFLRLSAVLNYQLSAKNIDWHNITNIILGNKYLSEQDRELLNQVFQYMHKIYGKKKRRLGPLSILHPLRATALLVRVSKRSTLLDLITTILHDNFEDIKPKNLEIAKFIKFDSGFRNILEKVPEDDRATLIKKLEWLTKNNEETYYRYIGRLLDQSKNAPEVVRTKLADRLDNTLDMRIEFEDPLQKTDFFEVIFQMMFSKTFAGYTPSTPHPPPAALNGAQRLYQLFKNIVLMSLVRQKGTAENDLTVQNLMTYLAKASEREAQRIALHIFGYHKTLIENGRQLLIETMEYVQKGGIDSITPPIPNQKLDGLFMSTFDEPKKKIRNKKLADLYADKPLMIQTAISFIVIFLSFLNNPSYYVKGISEKGIKPE